MLASTSGVMGAGQVSSPMIAEHDTKVLGQCETDGCSRAVLHVGPGPRRRYCDTACASRTSVAAHRASRKALDK